MTDSLTEKLGKALGQSERAYEASKVASEARRTESHAGVDARNAWNAYFKELLEIVNEDKFARESDLGNALARAKALD